MLSLQQLWYYFFNCVYLTHPVNFPCGRNPEHLQKTDNFRQIKTFVDSFHAHEFEAKSNAQTKRCMEGACSDDYAAEYF